MNRIAKLMTAVAFVAIAHTLFAYNGGYENSLDYKLYPGVGYANNELTAREESGTTIAASKYAQCKKLKSVDLTGVTSIGDAAFAYSALESVTIPATVQSMGIIAFGGCANLTSVTFCNTSWDWYVQERKPFAECGQLAEVKVACAAPSVWNFADEFPSVTKVKCLPSHYWEWSQHFKKGAVEVITDNYTLTLDPCNGESAIPCIVHVGSSDCCEIDWLPVKKEGFRLVGWYDSREGGEKVYDAAGVCVNGSYWLERAWNHLGDVTVYARWIPGSNVVADDLNGDGFADIVMTIDQPGHGADGATGAWLIGPDQIPVWGDLSQRNAGWDILGLGATTPGKVTKDVYLVSPDNVVGAWVTDASGKVSGWETIDSFDAHTEVGGIGDFNGDGQSDLLLVNDNGAVGCYFTSGAKLGWNYFQSLGSEWQICAIGDLNGDGRDDLVLLHDAGFAGSWLTQANGTMAWADLDTLPGGFEIAGCGDFDGDGTDDVLLKKGDYYGVWIVKDGNAKSWMGLGDLGPVTVEQIADFDGDGIDDLRIRTAGGDLGAERVKGADNLMWSYYGSVGPEWETEPLGLK